MFTASASESKTEGEPETLYDVLGIPETATIEEIKRAYYLLVRRYRPNEHLELFARFNEAHHTLSDPRRRGEYDQTRRSSRRVRVLLDQAAVALDRDQQKALTLLKNAIALAPDMTRPRYLLAYALMRSEEYGIAEKQYRWLIREMPRDETIRFRLARCLFTQGRLDEAEKELRKAFYINPRYHDAMMLAAKIHEATGDRGRAVDALEQAVANDGKENYADLEALMRLLVLHRQADNLEGVEATVGRIAAVIPPDEARATRAVQRLLKRAAEFFDEGDTAVALELLRVLVAIENTTPEKRAEIVDFDRRARLTAEAQRICDDQLIEPLLRELFEAKYLDRSAELQRGPRVSAAVEALQERILDEPRALAGAVEYLRREYPHIATDQEALLQEISQRVAKRVELLNAASKANPDEAAPFVMPGASAGSGAVAIAGSVGRRRRVLGLFRGRR